MPSFSERYGYTAPQDALQFESISNDTRILIYNVLHGYVASSPYAEDSQRFCKAVEQFFLRIPADETPSYPNGFYRLLKSFILDEPWFRVYDLLEYAIRVIPRQDEMDAVLDRVLESEKCAYRIVDGLIVPISDSTEIEVLATVPDVPDKYSGARMHLNTALERLADRPQADLRNAVKEAMSAVESAMRVLTDNDKITLGDALKELRAHNGVHPALASAWEKLYGFTSDSAGIRHGAVSEYVDLDFSLAKYLVVSSVAFVNYVVAVDASSCINS